MIIDLMRETKNYFVVDKEEGTFAISGGAITLQGQYLAGQYIAVSGSILNDGVYKLTNSQGAAAGFVDETFTGNVYALAVPKDFERLSTEIDSFIEQNPEGAAVSESFGGYSKTRQTGDKGVVTWQERFAKRINPFRKMFTEVSL